MWQVAEQSNPGGGAAVLRSASIFNSTAGQHPHRDPVTRRRGAVHGGRLLLRLGHVQRSAAGATDLDTESQSAAGVLYTDTNWNPVVGNPTVTHGSTARSRR